MAKHEITGLQKCHLDPEDKPLNYVFQRACPSHPTPAFFCLFFFFSFPLIQEDLGCFHTTKIRPNGPTNHPDGNMITALANGMQHFKSSHFNLMYNGTFLKQVNCPDETGILVHTDQILQLQLFKKQ